MEMRRLAWVWLLCAVAAGDRDVKRLRRLFGRTISSRVSRAYDIEKMWGFRKYFIKIGSNKVGQISITPTVNLETHVEEVWKALLAQITQVAHYAVKSDAANRARAREMNKASSSNEMLSDGSVWKMKVQEAKDVQIALEAAVWMKNRLNNEFYSLTNFINEQQQYCSACEWDNPAQSDVPENLNQAHSPVVNALAFLNCMARLCPETTIKAPDNWPKRGYTDAAIKLTGDKSFTASPQPLPTKPPNVKDIDWKNIGEALFAYIDTNGDGLLSKDEVQDKMREFCVLK